MNRKGQIEDEWWAAAPPLCATLTCLWWWRKRQHLPRPPRCQAPSCRQYTPGPSLHVKSKIRWLDFIVSLGVCDDAKGFMITFHSCCHYFEHSVKNKQTLLSQCMELVTHTLVWDGLPSVTCPVVRALKQTRASGGNRPPPAHVMLSHLNYVSSPDRCSAAGCSPCDDRGRLKRFSPGTVTPRRAEPGAATVFLQRDPQLFGPVCLKEKLQIIYTDPQNTYLDIRD